jgi:glycosyltransferase involved in cell wall biosynthesis
MPRDYFYELSARQVERGHDVDVLTWSRNGICSEAIVAEGFQVHRLYGLNFTLGGVIQEYPYLPGLPAKLEKLRPDIVHGESHLFLPTVQAVRKAKKLGLPCVVTVHGVFAERDFAVNMAQRVYLHSVGLEVFRRADRVICLTRSDAEEVIRFRCPSEKVRIIPNAVDTELFKPSGQRDDNLVVWVGRFVPEKGVEYLLEAARIVVKKLPDLRFLLAGYGHSKASLMKLAQYYELLGKSINFVGPLGRDEIAKILNKAAVFVFPSLKEGMPLALLEAMSCGKAVVGSDISGINDIITHMENGLLVPPRDPEAIANAILTLLADKKLRTRLGQNARQRMVNRYSWNLISDKIEKVYAEASGNLALL